MEYFSPPNPLPGNRHAAEIDRIVHLLDSYGVLTKERLLELCGADRWPSTESFDAALSRAVRSGRVRRLGAELYENAG
ncbi:MAG: hypothetical protein ACJ76V_03290 [Thermoleophilaceae bacterium]